MYYTTIQYFSLFKSKKLSSKHFKTRVNDHLSGNHFGYHYQSYYKKHPIINDHLSTMTTNFGSRRWSLYTVFTVVLLSGPMTLLKKLILAPDTDIISTRRQSETKFTCSFISSKNVFLQQNLFNVWYFKNTKTYFAFKQQVFTIN